MTIVTCVVFWTFTTYKAKCLLFALEPFWQSERKQQLPSPNVGSKQREQEKGFNLFVLFKALTDVCFIKYHSESNQYKTNGEKNWKKSSWIIRFEDVFFKLRRQTATSVPTTHDPCGWLASRLELITGVLNGTQQLVLPGVHHVFLVQGAILFFVGVHGRWCFGGWCPGSFFGQMVKKRMVIKILKGKVESEKNKLNLGGRATHPCVCFSSPDVVQVIM